MVFFLLLLTPLQAKAGTWSSVGPKGARIRALAISPNYVSDQTIFAGTLSSGVYKSTNRGVNWSAVNTGLSDLNVQSLVISPGYAADQTLFAGTPGGVYKSTDGGGNWSAVNTGLSYSNVQSLVISPNYVSNQTLFAGTYSGGVYKSTDGGGNWSAVNTGLSDLNVQSLVISPGYAADQTLFAGTFSGRVYKSTDGGGNWSEVAVLSISYGVQSFAISPGYTTDQTIFAGINGGGVYKSTTGGASWSVVNTGLSNLEVVALSISPGYATDQTIFAGINGGGGVYRSTNGGGNWSAVNSGLSSANGLWVRALAISPGYTSDQTIFTGTNIGGVFRSMNRGANWSAVNTGLNLLDVESLAISPAYTSDQTIFSAIFYGGVYKSVNGGGSWSTVNSGLSTNDVRSLAISPNYSSDRTLFVSSYWDGNIYKSANGGSSWSLVNTGSGGVLTISPNYASDQTIFTSRAWWGVFKSTDGGGTWNAVNMGLPNSLNALAVSPAYATDQTLFAGTFWYGVYKSTDGGGNWSAVNTGLNNLNVATLVISTNYASNQTIFAGTSGGGIYKSTNGGVSWSEVNAGLNNLNVLSLVVSPGYAPDQTLFAGTEYGGVYKSANAGGNWSEVNTGLGNLSVPAFAISPAYQSDRKLFAGTSGYSVWRYDDVCSPSPEVCNGLDDDCDGLVDEGVGDLYYQDSDSDAFGNPTAIMQACSQPSGYVSNDLDCDDANNYINPGVLETCNGMDDNCNSQIDEGYDQDGDTYTSCAGDCNDNNFLINPGAPEICNGVDDNCNGLTDNDPFYADTDGDGYGNPANTTQACSAPNGYVSNNADCDDGYASINPGASEIPGDGIDQNCDGFDVEARIDQASSGDQRFPWADYNETTGEYLVLWQDKRSGNDDIYGVRLDQNGNRIGSDIAVSTAAGHQQRVLVKAGGGGYLALWHDLRNQATNGADIYGTWISGTGVAGPEMTICACASDQWNPVAGYDPVSNTFLVVFLDARGSSNNQTGNVNDNFDLYGAVIPAGGSGSVTVFPVVTAVNGQRGPQIGYDYGNAQYYMAWNDRRDGLSVGYDIYGSRVTTTGTLLDGTGDLLIGAAGNQFRPTVTDRRPAAGINNHLIAWTDYRSGAQADVYGVRVNGAGSIAGSEFPISIIAADQANVVVDIDWVNTKKSLVGWIDQRNGVDYDIYSATVDQSGVVAGDTAIVGQATSASDDQRAQVVTYATDGVNDHGFLTVWMDRRNGTNYDIYGIKVWP